MNVYLNDLKPYFNIIDIRDKDEYIRGHVFNAKNIPMAELLNNPSYFLNKMDTYYIYCKSGYRSKKACLFLTQLGYKVVNVIDGYGE